jgi:hypothetical protein
MEFFYKKFDTPAITLYPIGDFHYGSRQCNIPFIKQVVDEIKHTKNAWWVGMGDMMENAIMGSKSDMYTQTVSPKEQIKEIVDLLKPIKDKGLFMIAGNHEQRTMRAVGLIPEDHIALQLDIPYKGFSCYAVLQTKSHHEPLCFSCYFHHNYGGGYTNGGKVNRADSLRKFVPTADATFSGHFHITSRLPVTWYEPARIEVKKKIGYDYITGSALTWNGSYAEEKAKPPASVEFIKVTFVGCTNGRRDNRQQIYEVIIPH